MTPELAKRPSYKQSLCHLCQSVLQLQVLVLRGKTLTEVFAEGRESQWQHFAPVASICLETVRFAWIHVSQLDSTVRNPLGRGGNLRLWSFSWGLLPTMLLALHNSISRRWRHCFLRWCGLCTIKLALTFTTIPLQDEAQDFVIIAASCSATRKLWYCA